MSEDYNEQLMKLIDNVKGMPLAQKLTILGFPLTSHEMRQLVITVAIDLDLNHRSEKGVAEALQRLMDQDGEMNTILTQKNTPSQNKTKPGVLQTIFSWFYSLFGWLILLIILSTLTSPNKIYEWIAPIEDPLRFLAYSISVALVLSLLSTILIKNHKPEGRNKDTAHIWVFENTKTKAKDATERDVYEHQFGYGSWVKKVRSDRQGIQALLFFITSLGAIGFELLIGRRDSLFGSGDQLIFSIASIALSAFIYIGIQSIFQPTDYGEYHGPAIFKPIDLNLDIKWAFLTIAIILLALFATISSIWMYLSSLEFAVNVKGFSKGVFVYSSILTYLVPIVVLFWWIAEKVGRKK